MWSSFDFADQDSFVLKIATVILSFITTAVTTYLKCFDLKTMEKQHKDAAEHFLVVRNELPSNWRNSYAGKVC